MSDSQEISLNIGTDTLDELEETFSAPLNRQERIRYCIERTLADERGKDIDDRFVEILQEAEQLRDRVDELEKKLDER